jgi:hypothetical protein
MPGAGAGIFVQAFLCQKRCLRVDEIREFLQGANWRRATKHFPKTHCQIPTASGLHRFQGYELRTAKMEPSPKVL